MRSRPVYAGSNDTHPLGRAAAAWLATVQMLADALVVESPVWDEVDHALALRDAEERSA